MTITSNELFALQWGAPHRLVVSFRRGRFVIDLELVKTNGIQTIADISVPDDITFDIITSTWLGQGEAWIELHARKEPYFIAGRAIFFREQEKMFLWSLLHFNEAPFDVAGFVDIKPEVFDELVRLNKKA